MKPVWMAPVLGFGVLVWQLSGRAPAASPRHAMRPPALVLMEGVPDGDSTDIVIRTPGANTSRTLGRITHVAGSARRAVLAHSPTRTVALVVAAERTSREASTYNSALFRVESGSVVRLIGDVTDASSPLVTESGLVLVQRGHDGQDPAPDENSRALRERTDTLRLDVVDVSTGLTRTVWTGNGQIAFLAVALRGDEVAIYHVEEHGAHVFALDAATGAVRSLAGPIPALARDFSYDRDHDELFYARAAAMGAAEYQVVALPVHGNAPAPRVVFRGTSDHLMPRVLADGAVALSLPNDHGLALLGGQPGGGQPTRVAPLGDGADGALAESADRRWIAIRHTESHSESLVLMDRAAGTAVSLERPDRLTELVGFATAADAQTGAVAQ